MFTPNINGAAISVLVDEVSNEEKVLPEMFQICQNFFDRYGFDQNINIGKYIIYLENQDYSSATIFSKKRNCFVKKASVVQIYIKGLDVRFNHKGRYYFSEGEIIEDEEVEDVRHHVHFSMGKGGPSQSFNYYRDENEIDFIKCYRGFTAKEDLEASLSKKEEKETIRKINKI